MRRGKGDDTWGFIFMSQIAKLLRKLGIRFFFKSANDLQKWVMKCEGFSFYDDYVYFFILQGPGHEYRKNYLQNVNALSDNQTVKPALPPKPAPPVKATPPPPPRQSAFHSQFTSQPENGKSEGRTYFGADFGRRNDTASDTHSSSGSDKEQSDKRLYSKANVDLANDLTNLNITRLVELILLNFSQINEWQGCN